MQTVQRSLAEVSRLIRDADALLFSPVDCAGDLIGLVGRGPFSHAALAGHATDGHLECHEVREWYGGRSVSLASQVRLYPNRIHVFETNPDNRWPHFDRAAAVSAMQMQAGCQYGWGHIFATSLVYMPVVRLLYHPDYDATDTTNATPPYCSEAVSHALACGGVDPIPLLADRWTEPSDLARSLFLRYSMTLVP